ncbi:MAG: mechanosensitive ion channel domain-containing protein [Cyanobacteria bacterium P01_F01_bin.143]
MKLKLYRITAFVVTSLAYAFIYLGVPVSAQEAEANPIEATITGETIPGNAKTISDPTILIEELELLVKPLTLEELENEAAAWLLLLKNKVQEISDTEIAIKRENKKIEAEQQTIKLLENAKEKLVAAEKAKAEAQPDTPEYEAAIKQLEKAKEALKKAETSVQELTKTEADLTENQALQENVEQAKQDKEIKEAQIILDKAKKANKDIASDLTEYEDATAKIEALEESINNLEKAEEDLASKIPDSPEYKEAEGIVDQAREAVKKARAELTKIMPGLEDETSGLTGAVIAEGQEEVVTPAQKAAEIEELFTQATSELENTDAEQLEKITEELEKKAEEEGELKKQLVVNATDLQLEQSAIVDRLNVVLGALDKKGGDTESYRKYIDAVTGVELDITDTEGLGVRLISWITSPDGGLNLIISLAKFGGILIVTVIVAPQLGKITNNILGRISGMSALFRNFVVIIVNRGTLIAGALIALAAIGVNLGPIIALVGGASFVLAFALQSNLGNFASGLMLLINKPFDVGDEVNVAGYWAYVDSISLASTKIKDFDGNIITLPNNTVWGSDIINYTHSDIRRLSFTIDIKFEQDMNRVYDMWMNITSSHPKVLDTPKATWFPWNAKYNYCISISLKAWSKTEDYWTVYVDILKELQKRIIELNIELTAPLQEIKLDQYLPVTMASKKTLLEQKSNSSED